MIARDFTCANLKAVIERANELLISIEALSHDNEKRLSIITNLLVDKEADTDAWELAALSLARLELLERAIRQDDKDFDRDNPHVVNGGLNI